jgi:TPR repeat protein
VEAYGRTGMRLLRHAEAEAAAADAGSAGGVPAYQLATLLVCEHRPVEALYWMRKAARGGHRVARRLAGDWRPGPPRYWRPADAAYEIGLHYEAGGRPFSAAVFFAAAAGLGHAEAAYRAGLHRMQIGRHWEAMLMFNRAASAGHKPAQHERDGLMPRVRRASASTPVAPQR